MNRISFRPKQDMKNKEPVGWVNLPPMEFIIQFGKYLKPELKQLLERDEIIEIEKDGAVWEFKQRCRWSENIDA